MRSTTNVRSAFEHQLQELPPDKDKEYLAQRTAGDPLTLYSQPDVPKASNTSAQMTESQAKRDIQLANSSLKAEFSTKFGIEFNDKLFANTVSLAEAKLDSRGALTVEDARKMFGAAKTVAAIEIATRARKAELTQQAKLKPSNASSSNAATSSALNPKPSPADTTTTTTSTTTVTRTTAKSQVSTVLATPAPDADLFEIVDDFNFVVPLAKGNRDEVLGLMRTAQDKLSQQASFLALGKKERPIALRRAAEGELIKFDIESRRGLSDKDLFFLKFLIDKAFRQPEHVLLHEVSSRDMHALLLTGNLEELCNLFNRGMDGPDALAALAQVGKANAQPFLAYAPKGMKVDYKGHITGEQTITVVPSEPARRMVGKAGTSIRRILRHAVKETHKKLGNKRVEVGNGADVFLPASAQVDFPRYCYKIAKNGDGSDGKWQEWNPAGKSVETVDTFGFGFVARQLFAFVSKSKDLASVDELKSAINAVQVLAAVVCQATLYDLQDFLETANGTGLEFLSTPGTGTVEWTLTKTPEGDYAVDIHFPVNLRVTAPLGEDLAETRKNESQAKKVQSELDLLVGRKTASIGATFRMTMIVDAQEAENGRVKVTIPDGMKVTFHDAI